MLESNPLGRVTPLPYKWIWLSGKFPVATYRALEPNHGKFNFDDRI